MGIKKFPFDSVIGFGQIKLNGHVPIPPLSFRLQPMHVLVSYYDIVKYLSIWDKKCLGVTNARVKKRLEPVHKNLGNDFVKTLYKLIGLK